MGLNLTWLDLNASYSHASLALPAIEAQSHRLDWEGLSGVPELKWQKVSGTIKSNINELVAQVISTRPDIVCATLWLFNHDVVLQVLSRVKTLLPHCTIALGGPEFLGDNQTFLRKNRFVDLVLRGEGEHAFYAWLKSYNESVTVGSMWNIALWKNVPGLCYLEQDMYRDQGTARVMAFDELIPPEESRFFPWEKPFVQLETTRGCFNTCRFCVSGGDKPVRNLSPEQIKVRLDHLYQKGVRNVRVLDRTFNGNEARSIGMLQLIEQAYPGMCFHLEIHPALLSPALRDQLRKMTPGKLHLEAGLQSLQEAVIGLAGRHGNCADAMEGIQFLKGLTHFQTHTDLIAGLPAYTYAATMADICTLIETGVTEIQMESLKVLPGTPFRERAEEFGLVFSQRPPYEVLQSDVLGLNELNRLLKISRVLDEYYNADAWREVIRTLVQSDPAFLEHFLDWLIARELDEASCSPEKRGELLYEYCGKHLPTQLPWVTFHWVKNGFSLKKKPAERLYKYRSNQPQFYYFALDDSFRGCRYIFGFDKMQKKAVPQYMHTISEV